jgi:hypothetical protein
MPFGQRRGSCPVVIETATKKKKVIKKGDANKLERSKVTRKSIK